MCRVSASTAHVELAEHRAGDVVGIDVEAIAIRQDLADHRLDAAEQLLVLQLLVAEAHQRLERDLVAQPVFVAELQHLGVDEALDQAKHVGVGAALDLAGKALLVGGQGREGIGHRKPVRQELVGGVETAAPDHVLVDVPADPLGGSECCVRTVRCCPGLCRLRSSQSPLAQVVHRCTDNVIG